MLRVLTSIAIAAAHLRRAAGADGRHRQCRQGHEDLQAQDRERQDEDLALRRQSAVLLGRDDQLLYLRIEDVRLPLGRR